MPHIENSDKEMYAYDLERMSHTLAGAPVGHVTYVLYVLALRWMRSFPSGMLPNWERRGAALMALNEAQHELRRLHLVAYEDQKIQDNGEAQ